jgi:hypothetical protein
MGLNVPTEMGDGGLMLLEHIGLVTHLNCVACVFLVNLLFCARGFIHEAKLKLFHPKGNPLFDKY